MIKGLLKRLLPPGLRVWLRFGLFLKVRGVVYSGKRYHCPCCSGNFRTFLPKKDGFEVRENVICPRCGIVERHRMLTLFLERKTDFFKKKYRVLHISPEYSTQWLFKKQHGEEYLSADLHSPIAMTHFDIQNIPFQDNHFSVIICGHVLAFVDNDEKALSELQRVLRPDGYLILQTDLHQHPDTVLHSDMEVSAMRTYSQWERLRSYGLDFFNKIESAGLSYQNISFGRSLTAREIEYFGINPEEIIIFCTKPS